MSTPILVPTSTCTSTSTTETLESTALRFAVGDKVLASVNGAFKPGTIIKLDDAAKPYRIRLDADGTEVILPSFLYLLSLEKMVSAPTSLYAIMMAEQRHTTRVYGCAWCSLTGCAATPSKVWAPVDEDGYVQAATVAAIAAAETICPPVGSKSSSGFGMKGGGMKAHPAGCICCAPEGSFFSFSSHISLVLPLENLGIYSPLSLVVADTHSPFALITTSYHRRGFGNVQPSAGTDDGGEREAWWDGGVRWWNGV